MEKNSLGWIKTYIVEVLPCFSILIYILAFIYTVSFFSVFNINVTNYLSFSDMLLNIIETLIIFALLSILLVVYFSFVLSPEHQIKIVNDNRNGGFSINIKILRFLALINSTKHLGSIIRMMRFGRKKMSEVRRKRIDKIKKRKEKKKRTIGFGNLYPFDLAIIILVISFILFLLLCSEDNRSRGLSIATLGLVMPIMIILVVVWILEFFIPIDYTILPQKINSHRLLEVLILYYIYSVTIFYYSGAKSGEACKKSNQVEFVIKTADGSTYNDSTYCYIDYINDKVFLMNKKNSHNIILNNENITYTDIHCIGDERKSLITIFFDSIRDRYHAH